MKNCYLIRRLVLFLLLLMGSSLILCAQSTFIYQGIRYKVTSSSTVQVISSNSGYSGDIVIPSVATVTTSYYGEYFDVSYQVTSIGDNAFRSSANLRSIELPNTITAIGETAFCGCHNLSDVRLSYGLDSIGKEAFYQCSALNSITIPNSVSYIGWNAFYECTGLTDVVLPKGIKELNGTFIGCSSLSDIRIPASVNTLDGTFTQCSSLQSVVIPNSVNLVGDRAFEDCTSLISVYIPNSVTSIGERAFRNTRLQIVVLPNQLQHIGDYAFDLCNGLTSITSRADNPPALSSKNCFLEQLYNSAFVSVPQQAVNVYQSADWWNLFQNLTGNVLLNNIYDFEVNGIYYIKCDDNNVYVTYKNTNYNSYNGNVNIPSTITQDSRTYHVIGIGHNAFYNCSNLSGVTIPNSVTSIGSAAFYHCSNLSSLTIPESITAIGDEAFSECTGLTQLTWNAKNCPSNGDMYTSKLTTVSIGAEVELLPDGFASGSRITSITIPSTVASIGKKAFNNCTSLTAVSIPKAVCAIGDNAFAGCNNLKTLAWNAQECWSNGNMYTSNINQITIGNDVKVIPSRFATNSRISTIILPSTVRHIGDFAFSGCGNLATFNLPDQLETIAPGAFEGCSSINSLTIPESVHSIGDYAFSGCRPTDLTWNAIDCGKNGNMTTEFINRVTIGDGVKKLPSGFVANSQISTISIPNSVDSIYSNAFQNCSGLSNIDIPNSVTYIGNSAFIDCSGLINITIPNAVTSIGDYAFAYCSGLTSVSIGEAVTSIGYYAFAYCSGLESVICRALEPPYLSYDAFYGVSSSMCVYVYPIAIDAYKSAYSWNQFEILPIDDVHVLSVSLPENVNVLDYVNMRLEVTDAESGDAQHYTLTDKSSYKFTVKPNSTWNVTLTNQYGDLFGKIEHVEVGEENVEVTFSSLLKPQDVSLMVKKPNGQDVTAQCKISWFDADGELLLQGNPIKKLPAGRKLKYQVSLPQDLATAYTLPSTSTYTVKDGNNEISCQLSAIGETLLSGKVKDATNNQSLYGSTISAVQSFGGGATKTITATTDNQGQYSLDASTVPTTLTIAATGYISQTIDCDMTSGGSTVTVPDVALSPITGAVVNINLTYTPAHAEGESAETQNWYSDYNNVDYEVYNMTTGHAITDISVQYPQIVLLEDVNDGDVLELTATSRKNAFKPVKTTVTIAEQKATATFNIKELGKVTATFNRNINPKVAGTLYDAENKLVKTADYTGSTQTIEELPDGNYQLVTMGKSDFFNSIYDLDQFAAAGLTEGDDYVKNEVQINSGIISLVSIDEVPFFDESKFYYTGELTSFTVNKPNIAVGNYLTFRAQVAFKEQYANQVSDVQLIVDLPESCSFIDNSVMAGAALAGYSTSGNRITIPMANYSDIVRFCAIPTMSGDFAPSAFVRFKLNGKYITQPIGNAPFTADGLSINVPTIVARTEIPISGTAVGVCNIDIYDNDVLIGQTISLANGTWSTKCELFDPYNNSTHRINAKVTTSQGLELQTKVADCLYDKYAIQVSKVVMFHVNPELGKTFEVVFDYLTPSSLTQYYTYYIYNKQFSFTIEFTDNDTNKVTNVVLYVKTAKSGWWPLEATYDSDKNCWFAQGEFGNMYDGDLPVNVSVDYDLLSWGPISRQSLSNAGFDYSGLSEEHDIIESEFLDFTNQFEAGIISSEDFETKFDELTSMETSIVSDSTFDNLDLVSLLSLSDSLVQESITYLNNALNVAFSELSEFGYFDLNEYGIDGSLEIKSTDGLSIDQLLNRGFEKIEIDDDSEVYQLVTETSYEIADFKKGTFSILSYNYENSNLLSSFNEAGGIQSLIDKVNQFAQKHTVLLEWIGRINEGLSYIPSFFELKIDDLTRAIEENTAAYKALQYYEGMMPTLEENLEISDQISKLKAENIKLGKERTHLLKNFEAVKEAIEKVTTIISALADAYSTGSNASEYINLWYSVPYCNCNPSKTEQLKNEIRNAGLRCAGKDLANIIGDIVSIHMIFGSVTAAPATGGSSLVLGVAGIGLSIIKGLVNNWAEREFAKERALFSNRISALAKDKSCKECPDPDPDPTPDPTPDPEPSGEPYTGSEPVPTIDPSGFVYEGVPSNRLQGVTATCYYKETVEDMYGDPIENVVLWDAENYGQENPLITDENGYYRWDVPIGMWQVKYEKEGYETTYSDWLPVPPPQLDVNIGMVQMRQPEVIKARAYPKAVEFEFDKFMFPESLTTQNIKVTDEWGEDVSGTIELLNAEVDDPLAITSIRRAPGTGLTFASKVRFNADYPFYGNEVTLKVSKRVKSYADLEMSEDYVVTLPIENEMEKIVVDTTLMLPYGDSRELTVTVLPSNASRGKTLSVRSVAPMIATTDAETYTLNNNGQATITVHGDLPGMTSLLYSIEGYDLTASTLVKVMMESEMTVATPTASIANGSVVPSGTAVYLRCATEGATIYYTLDGSCPCDPSPARKVYDGTPIIINSTTTIKAMATAPDLYDSDVATFVYRVGNGLMGDVNGDGEVNIADVNAVIDIILGGNVDADTRDRADVNEDGEINIADINAVINIILDPSRLMSHKVNCNDKLHLGNVSMKPGDVRTLQVNVDHASQYSAMQCDIVLPAGLTLLNTASIGNNVTKVNNLDETSSRALSYSPTKVPFASNGLGILTLTVRADEALEAESEIVLTNVVLADAENKAWHLADCKAQVNNTSGVNDLTSVADKVWVEGHTLFIEAHHDGTAQLATINGIVCDIPVKAGVNQHRLDQGIYIVVINGVSHKIAIK